MCNAVSPSVPSNTYVRKVDVGVYEFGWYVEPKNFRKGATVYTPVGTASSVNEAELQRSLLSPALAR